LARRIAAPHAQLRKSIEAESAKQARVVQTPQAALD
jgi:hypothetical protein